MRFESEFINSFINKLSETSETQSLVNQFWEEVNTRKYPIVEELAEHEQTNDLLNYEKVTFLYRSNEILENVFILAEFNFIDPKDYIFDKIDNTDIYYKTFVLPKNVQATYRILTNDPLDGIFAGAKYANRLSKFGEHPDRLCKNIQTAKDGLGPSRDMLIACLRPPPSDYEFMLEQNSSETIQGKLTEHSHESQLLGYGRKITIYTPKNYDRHTKYRYLLMFDGSQFINYGMGHLVIEKMIQEGQIPPIIGIFVDSGVKDGQTTRYDEYPCNPKFAESINDEILPWVKEKYSISDVASDGIIAGSSYGGLAAFYYSYIYPNQINNVISLSGSYHVGKNENSDYNYEWLPQQVAFSDKREIKAFLRVGKLEGEYHWDAPDFPNQIVSHRHFTTILKMKGYEFDYDEYYGDHSLAAWLDPFKEGLLYFLGN